MNIFLTLILMGILGILAWVLFSGEDRKTSQDETSPEAALLRRRSSDKEIEEKFPDQNAPFMRRKSDMDSIDEKRDIDEDFKLPYTANEIIPEASLYRVYHRTLVNAEIYAKKGDFRTAISLYEGVTHRISDMETNHRIESNIDYLRRYRDHIAEKKKKEMQIDAAKGDRKTHELKIAVDGPLSIPEKIQIGVAPPPEINIQKIAEEITAKLRADGVVDETHMRSIDTYKSEIRRLESRIDGLLRESAPLESEKKPAAIEAKYQSGVPLVLDPKPIIDLLAKIPGAKMDKTVQGGAADGRVSAAGDLRLTAEQAAAKIKADAEIEASKIKAEAEAEAVARIKAAGAHMRGAAPFEEEPVSDEARILENILSGEGPHGVGEQVTQTLVRDEKEAPEEWELKSRIGRDDETPVERMSDEAIFEKIIADDARKDTDRYEILGDKRTARAVNYDVDDRDFELKQREEERFYEKFLQHHRRVAKELPILKVSYDFSKLPDEFSLAREKNILEYSYYKYKPMLEKASEYLKKRKVKDAINYYKVVLSQNIPPEFKIMIRKNISDLTEYLEKYLASD